jgi:hypothetical protein
LIGDRDGDYPAVSKTTFENAIAAAQKTDDNELAWQELIDAAVSTLTAAKTTFLGSKIVADYALLRTTLAEAEHLYTTTHAGELVGQYPVQARNAFKDALHAADDIADIPHQTPATITEAIATLNAAVQAYKDAEITDIAISEATLSGVRIYPNPVKDYLYVDVEELPVVVRVYAANGLLLQEVANEKRLDLSSLPQGFYLLQVSTDKGNKVFNFIKE